MKVFNAPNDDMRVKTDSRLRGPDSRFHGNDMGGRDTRVPRIAQRVLCRVSKYFPNEPY